MMSKSLLRGMSMAVTAALAITASDVRAQALPGPNPSPTDASATIKVGGSGAQNVFVSILGGTDRANMSLYFFTSLPANLQAPVGGQLINPSKPALPNNNPGTFWTAGANSTQLAGGPFAAGSELIFGLLITPVAANYPAYWVWSGPAARNPGFPVAMLNDYGPGNVVYQNGGVLTLPGTPTGKNTYGFEIDYSRTIPTPFGDYNDFVFTVESRAVLPEPSTYALMLAGLAGMAVAARKRRRA